MEQGLKGVFTCTIYLLMFFSTLLGKETNMPPGDKPQEHGITLSTIWELKKQTNTKLMTATNCRLLESIMIPMHTHLYIHRLGFAHIYIYVYGTGLDLCVW